LAHLEDPMAQGLASLAPYIPPTLLRAVLADPSVSLPPAAQRFPAVVLFADVSGFTPLTERLAERGPEGAEELTALLNGYFHRLIGLVEAEGGEIVNFSGDALIVLFPTRGEPLGHAARRAKQAADAMQSATAGAIPSSAGPVTLGMKIGVGAGEVVAMQVGGVLNRCEYVVAGDPLRQVAEAEQRASRGEIIVSAEAAEVMYPGALAARPLAPPDWSGAHDAAALEGLLRRYVPAAVFGWLRQGLREWLAVLRPMSVLFIGIGGLDYASADAPSRLGTRGASIGWRSTTKALC
jgi:class 3 adenylate cyclase